MLGAILLGVCGCEFLQAETGREAWLRYAPLDEVGHAKYAGIPASAIAVGDSAVIRTAQQELVRGLRGMLGRVLREGKELPQENAIVLDTFDVIHEAIPDLRPPSELKTDGFWLTSAKARGHEFLVITATNDRGVLYGVFSPIHVETGA